MNYYIPPNKSATDPLADLRNGGVIDIVPLFRLSARCTFHLLLRVLLMKFAAFSLSFIQFYNIKGTKACCFTYEMLNCVVKNVTLYFKEYQIFEFESKVFFENKSFCLFRQVFREKMASFVYLDKEFKINCFSTDLIYQKSYFVCCCLFTIFCCTRHTRIRTHSCRLCIFYDGVSKQRTFSMEILRFIL